MRSLVWVLSIIVFSHCALGNPLPADIPLDSDLLSDDTAILNDFETPNSNSMSIPMMEFNAHTLDSSDLTSIQSPDTSWLTDSSAPPPNTANLFADSSDAPLESYLFPEFSDAFLESSCGGANGDSQPLSKRIDSGICTHEAEANPLLLKMPDMKDLENIFRPGIEKLPTLESFPILPTSGYTVDDDSMCAKPRRRLCCQGSLGKGALQGTIGSCRVINGLFLFRFFGFYAYLSPLFSLSDFVIISMKKGGRSSW